MPSLILPWARPPLTLNDRPGIHAKAKIVKSIRHDTAWCARGKLQPVERAVIGLVWYPGDRTVADPDNIAPTLKAAIDGLRDAKILAGDDARRVVRTWQQVVPRDLDVFRSPVARVVLVVADAHGMWQADYPPGEVGQLVEPSSSPGAIS